MVRGAMLRVVFSVRSGVDEEIFQWCTGTGVFVVLDHGAGWGRDSRVCTLYYCEREPVVYARASKTSWSWRRKHRGDNRPG